jgi:hypothetical protein
VLQARAFATGLNAVIRLWQGKPNWCVRVEPLGGQYTNTEVDLASVILRYGANQVASIFAKSAFRNDVDRNGVEEIAVCFSKSSLRGLFAGLPIGGSTVQLQIEGLLATGGSFEAPVTIFVLNLPGGGEPAAVLPNPLNPAGVLTFEMLTPGRTTVTVFSPSGRLIRRLVDDHLPAGRHEVLVDSRGPEGEPLASGVYLFRVDSPDGPQVGRFTVLR